MAARGERVISVATTRLHEANLPDSQSSLRLLFLGLVGLIDPVRDEVSQAVRECNEAGIRVVMITGDYPATADAIGDWIRLREGEVMTGETLNGLTDEQLRDRVRSVKLFALVIPEQKLWIVEALKAYREVVAMTGDGVNDTPALKAAHIGIAMGGKGTDVAREAALLVLLDDNFASIVSAIRSGRRIYDNLHKAMSYILAIHVPIIGLVLVPAFNTALPILLMPLHIAFMELIIDPVCTLAFETEQEEEGIMTRPPRDPDRPFFGFGSIFFSMMQGLLLLLTVMVVYFLVIGEGHHEGEVRAIAYSTLVLGKILLILTNISRTRNVFQVLAERNCVILLIIAPACTLLFLLLLVPALQELFSFRFPGFGHFLPATVGSLLLLLLFILETVKVLRRKAG